MTDTIFVTGGTGHLGHNLLPLLAEAGFRLRVLTRHPADHPWLRQFANVEVIEGEVENLTCIEQAVQGCRYVVHGAGLFAFWGKPAAFERTNILGTENVLKASLGAGVEKIIHISTVVVIGNPPRGQTLDENTPPHPADPYQRSKLRGEQIARRYFEEQGLPVVILRPGAFYGPYSRYAFNRLFIEDPLKGLCLQVNGGRNVTFPVYVGDVARGIHLALERGQAGETYNLCGETLTHKEANRIISDEAGLSSLRINVPQWALVVLARAWTALSEITQVEPYYPINLRTYVFYDWRVSSEKARTALHFEPIPFREGVRHTLRWYQDIGLWKGKRGKGRL